MMTLANSLTLMRIAIVPFFIYVFVLGEWGLALLLFCIAGATDLVDGTVARKFGRPTRFGAMLDPIADKFLVQSCFIALGVVGVLPWWFVILAFLRDLMITTGILYLVLEDVTLPYKPAMVSKFATLFQMAVAILALVSLWKPDLVALGRNVDIWLIGAILVTAVLLFLSGIKYVTMGLDILKQHRERHA
jgi:cardiolipin synthase